MPPRLPAKSADLSRDKLFWLIALAMVLGQLGAFWMLCAYQVRQAQVRHAAVHVERVAVDDCLRSIRGATLTSCAVQVTAPSRDGIATVALDRGTSRMQAGSARMGDAVPINYVYR